MRNLVATLAVTAVLVSFGACSGEDTVDKPARAPDASATTETSTGSDSAGGTDSAGGSDSGIPGVDSSTGKDAGTMKDAAKDAPIDAPKDAPNDAVADAKPDADAGATFTLNLQNYLSWCSVAVNGGTANTTAVQNLSFPAGTVVNLTGAEANATFVWGYWVGTTGDVSATHDVAKVTTVVLDQNRTVQACCPFANAPNTPCPAPN